MAAGVIIIDEVMDAPTTLVTRWTVEEAQQQRRLDGALKQILEEGQRGFVGKVQVIDDRQNWALGGEGGEIFASGPQGLLLAHARIQGLDTLPPFAFQFQADHVDEERHGLAGFFFAEQFFAALPQAEEQSLVVGFGRIEIERAAQHLRRQPVADLLAERKPLHVNPAQIGLGIIRRKASARFSQQARFAQAAVADDRDHSAAPRLQVFSGDEQLLQGFISPDHGSARAGNAAGLANLSATAQHLVDMHGDALAFDLHLALVGSLAVSGDALLGAVADEYFLPTRFGHQASGHVDIITHQGVFLAQVGRAGVACKEHAGVDADALAEAEDALGGLQG